MKFLVFGQTGQVAQEIARRLPPGVSAQFLSRSDADLNEPERCAARVDEVDCDAVINAAAWTAVDLAESKEQEANRVNAVAPSPIAKACCQRDLSLLHISTDYVFDGAGDTPFHPDDPTAPLSAYGRSKLKGEEGIRSAGCRHLILRTSWVVSAHGSNFVKTMLRLGRERDSLNIVADQIGGPTPAADIADALVGAARTLLAGHVGGTYHFSGAPDTSWAGFARSIMSLAGINCRINEIATSAYPTPAPRPLNSRLDCSSFTVEFGVERPEWVRGLKEIFEDLGVRQ